MDMETTKSLLVHNGFVRIDRLNWKPVDKITNIKNEGHSAQIVFIDGSWFNVCIVEGGILPLLRKLRGE